MVLWWYCDLRIERISLPVTVTVFRIDLRTCTGTREKNTLAAPVNKSVSFFCSTTDLSKRKILKNIIYFLRKNFDIASNIKTATVFPLIRNVLINILFFTFAPSAQCSSSTRPPQNNENLSFYYVLRYRHKIKFSLMVEMTFVPHYPIDFDFIMT